MIAENQVKVGDTVSTPDGEGKVVNVDTRYISVDLVSGKKANYELRDLNLAPAK